MEFLRISTYSENYQRNNSGRMLLREVNRDCNRAWDRTLLAYDLPYDARRDVQ